MAEKEEQTWVMKSSCAKDLHFEPAEREVGLEV